MRFPSVAGWRPRMSQRELGQQQKGSNPLGRLAADRRALKLPEATRGMVLSAGRALFISRKGRTLG